MEVLQNPITRVNFNNMHTRINSADCTLWETIEYLKECKRTIAGFDFRYKLDANTFSDGIMVMTPRNRYNLIRFGNIIFFDAQKRQMNNSCWSYIGSSIQNCGLISTYVYNIKFE